MKIKDGNKIEVIRYPNRKLYIPGVNYTNMSDVVKLIQTGYNVTIVDKANKNKDITVKCLAQYLVDNNVLDAGTIYGAIKQATTANSSIGTV